jgi:hypothetical protein
LVRPHIVFVSPVPDPRLINLPIKLIHNRLADQGVADKLAQLPNRELRSRIMSQLQYSRPKEIKISNRRLGPETARDAIAIPGRDES